MTTIARSRLVSRSTDLEAEDVPEQVTIALREIAGAAKEGLLAFSVGIGLAVLDELFEAEVMRLAGPRASTPLIVVRTGMAANLARSRWVGGASRSTSPACAASTRKRSNSAPSARLPTRPAERRGAGQDARGPLDAPLFSRPGSCRQR